MNRISMLVLVGMFSAGTAVAQSDKDMTPPPQQTPTATSTAAAAANGSLANGSPIEASLSKTLDTKKAKKGDPVDARITEDAKEQSGTTLIPKGSKLEGHVTQASSREKGDSYSTLGIVFDKAVLKDGQEVPLNVSLQAIALSQDAATMPSGGGGMSGMSPAGGGSQASGEGRPGAMGGGTSSAPSASPMPTNTNGASNIDNDNAMAGKGAVGGLTSSGKLSPNSRGVFGLQGIGLASASEGTQQAAVITSTEKNVHLDGGTQLLLVTQSPKS
jgi:hypothetical protein